MKYPPGFPSHLKPTVELKLLRAQHRFPSARGHRNERVKEGMAEIAEIALKAAEEGEWGLESALLGLEQFIHFLCVQDDFNNRYSDSEDFEAYITREITTSKEWLRYLERLESIAETELNKPEELVTIAVEKSKNDRKSEREAIRTSYFARFS